MIPILSVIIIACQLNYLCLLENHPCIKHEFFVILIFDKEKIFLSQFISQLTTLDAGSSRTTVFEGLAPLHRLWRLCSGARNLTSRQLSRYGQEYDQCRACPCRTDNFRQSDSPSCPRYRWGIGVHKYISIRHIRRHICRVSSD